jgi:hypothetical protein
MGKGQIAFYYKRMSAEDQRRFNRWLKANAILGRSSRPALLQWQWLAPCRRDPVMRRSPAVRELPTVPHRNSAAGKAAW